MTPHKGAGAVRPAPEEDAQNAPMDDATESTKARPRDKWEGQTPLPESEVSRREARLTGDAEEEEGEDEDEWDGTPPPGVMPPWLEAFRGAVAAGYNSDPVMPTALIPAVLAGCTGQRAKVRLGANWLVACILWHAVIAPKGLKKTHVLNFLKGPLKRLRGERIELHEARQAEHAAALRAWKSQKPKERGTEPKAPPIPAMPLVSDTTLEALAPTLAGSPACLMAPDELRGTFLALGEYKGGRGADRQRMLSLRSGVGIEIDRKSDGPLDVAATGLSIVGGIQPDVVLENGASEEDRADGMLDRFGWVFASAIPYAGENAEIPASMIADWESLCLRLSALAPDRVLTLSLEARQAWHDFQSNPANDAATCAPLEAGFANKKGDTIGALAGIFTLVEAPEATVISGETFKMALRYWEWLMHHNRRLLAMAAGSRSADPEADRVKTKLEGAGGEMPHDNLRDALGWKSPCLGKVLARMERKNTITVNEEPRRGGGGGRPRRMVRLVGGAK